MNREIEELNRKVIYETEYAALMRNNSKFNYKYWLCKDKVRYYNELIDEVNRENQKPNDYPKFDDKILFITAICISFYNTGPEPNMQLHKILYFLFCVLGLYVTMREMFNIACGTRSILATSIYQNDLKPLVSQKTTKYEDLIKYHPLKLRVFNLESRKCKWSIVFLLLEILYNIVLIGVSIYIICLRDQYGFNVMIHDAFLYILSALLSISIAGLYLKIAIENLEWYLDSKEKLF